MVRTLRYVAARRDEGLGARETLGGSNKGGRTAPLHEVHGAGAQWCRRCAVAPDREHQPRVLGVIEADADPFAEVAVVEGYSTTS